MFQDAGICGTRPLDGASTPVRRRVMCSVASPPVHVADSRRLTGLGWVPTHLIPLRIFSAGYAHQRTHARDASIGSDAEAVARWQKAATRIKTTVLSLALR